MVALDPCPNQSPDRQQRLSELKSILHPRFPHLANSSVDMGSLDIFMLNPDLRGRDHSVWLTDGEVSGSIEMSGLHPVPNATYALQLEIISLEDQQQRGRYFFGWHMLILYVVGNYDPTAVVEEIETFGRSNDAYAMLHYLAHKIDNPPGFDLRTEQPSSLEEYLGVLDQIQGRSLVISSKRQIGEFEQFMLKR